MPAVRAIPWARVFAVARVVLDRFADDIPKKDRTRLATLLRKSKGDPRRLTAAERREIVRIIRQVDVAKLGRDVASVLALARSGRLLKRG
ncbi:MAG: hypothetical protein M3320_01800 [Actinomycetota bacterium]|nr:hypothetical protein [Actinomycetota bacterium]MDQ5807386.1 hypothetical protein [Actinomycetota bacterium]